MQQMPPYRCCPLLPAPPKGEDASLRLLSQRSRLNYCVDEITTVRSATIAGYFPRRQAKRVLSEAVQRGNRWAARAGGGRPAPHETLSRASRHQRNQTARVVFVNRHASLVRIAGGPEGPRRAREAYRRRGRRPAPSKRSDRRRARNGSDVRSTDENIHEREFRPKPGECRVPLWLNIYKLYIKYSYLHRWKIHKATRTLLTWRRETRHDAKHRRSRLTPWAIGQCRRVASKVGCGVTKESACEIS